MDASHEGTLHDGLSSGGSRTLSHLDDVGADVRPLLGKTLAVARVLCPLVAREAALLIRRYNYCLAVTRARTRYC